MPVVRAILDDNKECLIEEVMRWKGAKEHLLRIVNEECETICAPVTNSGFRDSSLQGLTQFSFQN